MDAGRSSNKSLRLDLLLGVLSASGSRTLVLRDLAAATGGGDLDLPLSACSSATSSSKIDARGPNSSRRPDGPSSSSGAGSTSTSSGSCSSASSGGTPRKSSKFCQTFPRVRPSGRIGVHPARQLVLGPQHLARVVDSVQTLEPARFGRVPKHFRFGYPQNL